MHIFFAILLLVGSLGAWRASPLYSLKSTFKLAGATILIAATAVSASWAILDGPLKASVGGQVAVGLAAFLLVSTGGMALIIRITDSHVAALPDSVKLVSVHRHRILRWGGRFVVYLLVCAAAAFAVPASWQWLPQMLGGFPLLVCGPMLGILYMMARRNDRGMSSVMAAPWAHWQYSPEQWQAWMDNDAAWQAAKQKPMTVKGAVLFILFCAGLFALGTLTAGGFTRENTWLFVGLTGFVVLILLVVGAVERSAPGRRRRMLQAAPHEAWLGEEGAFLNGEYIPWTLSGRYLLSAACEAGPPQCLVLEFESFNGSSSIKLYKRAEVPADAASELAMLQKRLSAQCATASVRLVDQ